MSQVPAPTIAVTSVLGSIYLALYSPQSLKLLPSYIGITLLLFLIQLIVWGVWRVVLYPRYFSPLRHLPEPKDNAFFTGQLPRIRRESAGAPMEEWINEIPNDGLIRYRGMLNADRLLLTSPRALGEVLTQKSYEFVKPGMLTGPLSRILGVGVLLAEGDLNDVQIQRRNLMPAFAFRHIKNLYPIFWSKSRELVQAITCEANQAHDVPDESESNGVVIEIGQWASRATLDIIGVAGMGNDFKAIQDPDTELNRVYRAVFTPSKGDQLMALLSYFIPAWILRILPIEQNSKIRGATDIIRKTCRDLIRQKKRRLEEGRDSEVDILSVAIKSGGFPESNLVDQLMTFLAAGHETTATALLWAVYLLCKHPDVQSRLRTEIRASLLSIDIDETKDVASNIERMAYLHAVCNEALRLNTPVPVSMRKAAHDNTILGQYVPAGTLVMIAPWAVNRSTALWGSDAKEFKPERWMGSGRANTGGADSNYSFLTFLHGPRSCIGQGFAKAEFACLLAALVGRFEMELVGKEPELRRPARGITSKPEEGLHVRVRIVEGW